MLLGYIVLVIIVAVGGTAVYGALRAAPWLPTRARDLQRVVDAIAPRAGQRVVDLGAGDGRLMTAIAAQYPDAQVEGYEISLLPYLVARIRFAFSPHRRRLHMHFRDFYLADFRPIPAVVCFLTPGAMRRLEPKLRAELQPGARFVSYAFKLPTWPPTRCDRTGGTTTPVWVYDA